MIFLGKWLVSAIALLIASWLLAGVHVESIWTALIAAVFLGFFNAIVRPVLVILTLPITVVTLGFFILVINGFLFWMLSFIKGFYVDGVLWGILGALVVSVVSWFGNQFLVESYKHEKKGYYRVDGIEKP